MDVNQSEGVSGDAHTVQLPPRWLFTLMLGLLAMLGPFCVDAFLPAMPAIGRSLGAGPVVVQQTLSVYLLAFAFMMLFHGTLSDSFGRRRTILVSLVAYVLASAGAALSQHIALLLLFRACQGLSAGSGVVVGRAIIRDCYKGHEAQRALSHVTMVFAISPALAPILGGWLLVWFTWRAVFVFLTVMGMLALVLCWRKLPETLPPARRQAFRAAPLMRNYLRVIRHRGFLLMSLAFAFLSGGYFVYIASAPAFILNILHRPGVDFGWLFIPIVTGLLIGSYLSGHLAHRLSPVRMIAWAYAAMAVAALLNLVYNATCAAVVPWAVLPMVLYNFGAAFAMPALTVLILDLFPDLRGMTASLQASSQMLMYTFISGVLAPLLFAAAIKLALGMAGLLLLSMMCWRIHAKRPVH